MLTSPVLADRTRAVRIHAPGPASAFVVEDVPLPAPAAGEVRVRHTAIGVNFIDVNHRNGAYPLPMPAVVGTEAAGVVVEDVRGFKAGDRVAYQWKKPGAYVDERNVPADRVLRLPPHVSDETAAALLLKGLTAEYLLRRTVRVDATHTIVIHAAAGGVGSLLVAWGRAIGAKVIGIVSTDDKAPVVLALGAHHVLVSHRKTDDLAARVRAVADGGVDVVYDSVGKDTFEASLDMLKPRGMLVSFGQASGPVPPFPASTLQNKGSLYITRPALHDYVTEPGEYRAAADAVFEALRKGHLAPRIHARVPLVEAQRAHEELEARKTTGSIVLVP